MRVLCMNDKGLPEGAEVRAGKDYKVIKDFINNWGQRTFLIEGIKNKGTTKTGFMWYGYAATRFSILENAPEESIALEEELAILN